MIQPQPRYVEERAPRARPHRRAKLATHKRKAAATRARYVQIARIGLGLAVAVAVVLTYVCLTANLTSLNYRIARAERERAALADESLRLDDRIAQLQSRDRLAAIAAKLHMTDPHLYAVVRIPSPPVERPKASGIALIGDWFAKK